MAGRKLAILGLMAVTAGIAALVSGCGSAQDPWSGTTKPRVVASFPPIYCFAQNVAGDHVALRCLCTIRGPHDYEYNPKDTLQLKTANLLLSNGIGMDDHFADRLQANSGNGKLRVRKLGEGVPELKKMEGHVHTEGEAHHHHGEHDPHIWLGIPQAIAMVNGIRDELKVIDPAHAADYDKNAASYIEKLKKLHEEGRQQVRGLKSPIITFHESLTYFADSFGIKIGGSIQGTPGSEPQSPRLLKLIKLCKDEKAHIITIEPQYPPTSANTLKERLKKEGVEAVLVVVDPLETATLEEVTPSWYEDKMRQNLKNLAEQAR